MNLLSHDQRVEALSRLEATSDYRATQTLRTIDSLLVSPDNFSGSDLKRILEKRKYPIQVERALKLYSMMARLTRICEPKGAKIGPTCAVRPIDFEQLTFRQALDLRNGIGLRLLFKAEDFKTNNRFSGLDLLTPEEKELYEQVKLQFVGRERPTLKLLAARLLRTEHEKSFSDRGIIRYPQALKEYKFTDHDLRRDYMIRSVDSFGAHNQSTRESLAYAMAQAAESFKSAMVQAAVQIRGNIPVITQQIRESVLMAQQIIPQIANIPQTISLMVHSMAQIPNVMAQIQNGIAGIAELYRSIPQTLALLANLTHHPKVRQN